MAVYSGECCRVCADGEEFPSVWPEALYEEVEQHLHYLMEKDSVPKFMQSELMQKFVEGT